MEHKIEEKKSLLTRLQERNDHDKKVFSIMVATVFTFIILIIWLINLLQSLPNTVEEDVAIEQSGPFSVFVEFIRSSF